MSARTVDLLQAWIDEFRTLGYVGAENLRVVPHTDEHDEGLVAAQMSFGPTRYYVAPSAPGGREWRITFEEREEPVSMTASRLLRLSSEFATLSALCAFLQARSDAQVTEREPRTTA
jgi:hypothetical protein